MLVSTEAIVLSYLKYSETSIIVKCFTQSDGLKSYLIKGVRSAKKKKINIGIFQPLTILEIDANHRNQGNLESIRSAKIIEPYKTIHFEILKNTIVLFISEILSKSIKEEEENKSLFDFIKTSMIWLDSNSNYVNFHIQFLIKFLKHLGISPNESNIHLSGFNMLNGNFCDYSKNANCITGNVINHFKEFLGTNFDGIEVIIDSSIQRKELLEFLMKYMQIHLEDFRRPQSLNIMYDLFKRK
ncbi:MAG TPA: DNA repair protein RecO [Cytophagales bacterium]|jgi:DNA repair protein RecO (recombination protein O)|nr:DNA repair protein RecO [Cytophagales bacterium]